VLVYTIYVVCGRQVGTSRENIEELFSSVDTDNSDTMDSSQLDAFLSNMGVHFTYDELQTVCRGT
jgi:hypothetical protein